MLVCDLRMATVAHSPTAVPVQQPFSWSSAIHPDLETPSSAATLANLIWKVASRLVLQPAALCHPYRPIQGCQIIGVPNCATDLQVDSSKVQQLPVFGQLSSLPSSKCTF